MYHVKKLPSDFTVTDERSQICYFKGISWGVFDESDNLNYYTNQHGNRIYDVYSYKYVAQHQANHLNSKE